MAASTCKIVHPMRTLARGLSVSFIEQVCLSATLLDDALLAQRGESFWINTDRA